MGLVWPVARVDAFSPKGHGFDSRTNRHVGTLSKSFTHSCLWHFGMKCRHSIRAVSGAPLSSSGLEEALHRNSLNEWYYMYTTLAARGAHLFFEIYYK